MRVAACQYDFGGAEPGEMPRRLQAKADISAGHNDSLSGELLFGSWQPPELIVEEGNEKIAIAVVRIRVLASSHA